MVASIPDEIRAAATALQQQHQKTDAHFREVFESFVQTQKECGEDTSLLEFEKFKAKLLRTREKLMASNDTSDVRFSVYVKNGAATLKATPVKH
ncbi:MAG: MXAN_5187 C-terminal domain-containing protein [Polyangiales bacterium]